MKKRAILQGVKQVICIGMVILVLLPKPPLLEQGRYGEDFSIAPSSHRADNL